MSSMLITQIVGGVALLLLLPFWNRVRLLQWRRHQWRVVLMYLCCTLWLGWQCGSRLLPGLGPWLGVVWLPDVFDFAGLVGLAMLISTTRGTWRGGAPEHVKSAPGALDSRPHVLSTAWHGAGWPGGRG